KRLQRIDSRLFLQPMRVIHLGDHCTTGDEGGIYGDTEVRLRKEAVPMSHGGIGRNDACPCGSGRKFKHCCLLRRSSYRPPPSAGRAPGPAGTPFGPGWAAPPPGGAALQQRPSAFEDSPPDEPDDQPAPPPLDAAPLLPVEVRLEYTYPEPFGEAEVSFLF